MDRVTKMLDCTTGKDSSSDDSSIVVSEPLQPRIGLVMTDKTGTKYLLERVIGTCDEDRVYKAAYYTVNEGLRPSGYVTLKLLRTENEEDWSHEQSMSNTNLMNVVTWDIGSFYGGTCVALPFMSEGSLRYMLKNRFHTGFTEDLIATVLKEALIGLSSIHTSSKVLIGLSSIHTSSKVHKHFSAGCIFVNFSSTSSTKVDIKLAFGPSVYDSDLEFEVPHCGGPSVPPVETISEWAAAPEVYHKRFGKNDSQSFETYYTEKTDVWLVGIAALELAYGTIRVHTREQLDILIKKLKSSKKLPASLKNLSEEIMTEKFGAKLENILDFLKAKLDLVDDDEERVFSDEFEEMVLKCLSTKPSKRPTVSDLLQREFFINARSLKWFQKRALHSKRASASLVENPLEVPRMNARLAESIVRHWQNIKSSLGTDHCLNRLSEVLDGQMLKFWTERATEFAQHGWFWEYKLLNLAIDSVTVSADGQHATVKATLKEILTVAVHPERKASYNSTHTTRYGMSWVNSGWKIVEESICRIAERSWKNEYRG